MQLKTLVKVGEINNLSDARYSAGMGVDILGFIFKHPDRKTISKEEYVAITGWVSGPKFVGEFIDATDDEVIGLHKDLKFDFVQTNDFVQAKRLKEQGLNIIFLQTSSNQLLNTEMDYVLVENTLSVEELKNLSQTQEVLLGSNITVDNLDQWIAEDAIVGINLKGSDEIRPGYKDFDELGDILEALEVY